MTIMAKKTNIDNPGDITLGGYVHTHERPPAFQGFDGLPYTVSIEIETVSDLANPYVAYLVFPQWASTGVGIIGHLQTPVLFREKTLKQAESAISSLKLSEVKLLLDKAIDNSTGRTK